MEVKILQRSELVDFLILLANCGLATFLWLATHTCCEVSGWPCLFVADFITSNNLIITGFNASVMHVLHLLDWEHLCSCGVALNIK